MITPASSNSEQPYLNTEPPVAAETTATTKATAAPSGVGNEISSILKTRDASTQMMPIIRPPRSQNMEQMMAMIMQMITMLLELMKLRNPPQPPPFDVRPMLPGGEDVHLLNPPTTNDGDTDQGAIGDIDPGIIHIPEQDIGPIVEPDTTTIPDPEITIPNPEVTISDPEITIPDPEITIPDPKVSAPPIQKPIEQGSALDRSAGFLWKPESDKNQKLAILLPPNLAGKVAEVIVLSPDGKRTLQRGKYSGVGNGAREHYRFSKAGSEFPDGSIVVIKLKNGTTKHMVIKETSARLEKK